MRSSDVVHRRKGGHASGNGHIPRQLASGTMKHNTKDKDMGRTRGSLVEQNRQKMQVRRPHTGSTTNGAKVGAGMMRYGTTVTGSNTVLKDPVPSMARLPDNTVKRAVS